MRNLFEGSRVDEIKRRLDGLRPESARQWGTMNPAQVVAHCSGSLEMALGDWAPERIFFGRILGVAIKPMVLGNDEPMRRNSPTMRRLVIDGSPDFRAERERLRGLIDRFAACGPNGFKTHPHSFFGPLTPAEWSILMYKHLDHHLRQFGV